MVLLTMASEENQVYAELENDGILEVTEILVDKPNCEQQLGLQNIIELARKERKMPWEETAREDFVKGFPTQKKEIEKYFSCLQEVANHIDRIHKGCTTASLVSCSTSATSGILTILGLTLAPITAGGSLILTATGIGLGAGATAIGLSAALYENIINSKERKRAEGLVNACEKSLRKSVQPLRICSSIELTPNNRMMGKNVRHLVSNISGKVPDVEMVAKKIKINVKAWKTAQTHLKTLAKQAANAGRSSWSRFKSSKDIKKAFSGPTLAMTKGARMLNAVSAGLFLLVDTYALVQDAKHLMKGGKAELASEIRKKATLFEEELQNLSKLYNELKDLE
ncbi:apolipoprotein L3-like [Pseudonaja textilis]|uniref:apolipoprotein L3-like n=1 Tax=Pseudonaja textilis TaxID=8673 RepID=UPI000EA90C7F|nr:apolipoprotein L3-like [Pseudonaja textilis]